MSKTGARAVTRLSPSKTTKRAKAKPTPRVKAKAAPRAKATPKAKPKGKAARTKAAPRAEAIPVAELLQRAMDAKTPRARLLWARRGLASARGKRPDATMESMLLRQLYLAFYETRRFEAALAAARENLALDVLPDVVHQDAARAAQALGEIDAAASHLRLAARSGPVRRRAFHWWTLGSLFFLAGRHADAITALTRAARWGTTDKPLYQGHLAMARVAAGEPPGDLGELIERLTKVPAGQGYGRFVLGHLAFHAARRGDAERPHLKQLAERYLDAFVKRSTSGRVVLAIALEGEIALARRTLATLAAEHDLVATPT